MTAAEEYKILAHVGPGTPMGKLMRRYWIPAVMSEEIPEPGGAPVRVRLLGESLVAFRDPKGNVGLIKEHCPHRGASLAYARNEEGGLRCIYHGWKMSREGRVLETPAEQAGDEFAKKICHKAYRIREIAGMVWAYMGPPEMEPPFPVYPWMHLKPPHLLVAKMRQDCNYLQGVEGEVDPAHPNYVHRQLHSDDKRGWNNAGWKSVLHMMYDGAPKIVCEDTPHSFRYSATRKTRDPKIAYVRLTECIAPFYSFVATGRGEAKLFKAWQPIDDGHSFAFYIHYDESKPLDVEAIYENWGHRTAPPDYRTPCRLDNHHLQDRSKMSETFTGIHGAAIQDLAVQESMGAIYDHTQETLGTSDMAVIYYRRRMLRAIRAMEEGKPLPAQDTSLSFDLRSVSCYMPADRPWKEVVAWQDNHRWQEEAEKLLDGAISALHSTEVE